MTARERRATLRGAGAWINPRHVDGPLRIPSSARRVSPSWRGIRRVSPSRLRARRHRGSLVVVLLSVLGGCARLPEDDLSLPLEQKIEAYIQFYDDGGFSSYEAVAGISLHGDDAAEAMIPFLTGQRRGIPETEAIHVVELVHLRGCSLKDAEIERTLSDLRSQTRSSEIYEYAGSVLELIEDDIRMSGGPDSYGAGAFGGHSAD